MQFCDVFERISENILRARARARVRAPPAPSSRRHLLPEGTFFQKAPSSRRHLLPEGTVFQKAPSSRRHLLPEGTFLLCSSLDMVLKLYENERNASYNQLQSRRCAANVLHQPHEGLILYWNVMFATENKDTKKVENTF